MPNFKAAYEETLQAILEQIKKQLYDFILCVICVIFVEFAQGKVKVYGYV